jgi:hypothetical protein
MLLSKYDKEFKKYFGLKDGRIMDSDQQRMDGKGGCRFRNSFLDRRMLDSDQ